MFETISKVEILIGIIIALIVLKTFKFIVEKRHIFKFASNYGGYMFCPIIGNACHVGGKDVFTIVEEIIDKFGLPSNIWLGNEYGYMTDDASEMKIILNHPNCLGKMKIYDNFKFLFKNSLLLAPADEWKRHRKLYSKSFSQPILNSFIQKFSTKSIILLDVEGRDPFGIFERYTFDCFCETMMGIDSNLQMNLKRGIIEWIAEFQAIGGRRLINYCYYPLIFWIVSNDGRRLMTLKKQCISFIYDIIKQKRKIFAENPVSMDSHVPLSLLDSMLQEEGEKFSNQQVFQEIFFFTLAATDTSGYTLAYIFTLLGMHPEIQEKVYQEVISVVGDNKPVCYTDLPNLKYTERAIFEAMRLLPVAPLVGRFADADIDTGTKIIPKGTNIIMTIFRVHRNEKYWPNPLKYDPDRFLPEEIAKREAYSYIPFLGGPKNCIGKTYAIMLLKTTVANIVRNFEILSKYKSVDELKLTSCVTMRTSHPLDCRFKLRIQDQ